MNQRRRKPPRPGGRALKPYLKLIRSMQKVSCLLSVMGLQGALSNAKYNDTKCIVILRNPSLDAISYECVN